jgi:hypothetical protein
VVDQPGDAGRTASASSSYRSYDGAIAAQMRRLHERGLVARAIQMGREAADADEAATLFEKDKLMPRNDELITTVNDCNGTPQIEIRSGDGRTFRLVRLRDGQELQRIGALADAEARARGLIDAGHA